MLVAVFLVAGFVLLFLLLMSTQRAGRRAAARVSPSRSASATRRPSSAMRVTATPRQGGTGPGGPGSGAGRHRRRMARRGSLGTSGTRPRALRAVAWRSLRRSPGHAAIPGAPVVVAHDQVPDSVLVDLRLADVGVAVRALGLVGERLHRVWRWLDLASVAHGWPGPYWPLGRSARSQSPFSASGWVCCPAHPPPL